jgi:YHS domain-containing protein
MRFGRRIAPRTILGAGSLLLALSLAGCFSEREFGAYDPSTHMWDTATGIKAEDRVSGRLIDPDTAILLEYRGDIYYFENEFTAEMFKRDPGVYDYHEYAPLYGGGP